VADRAAVETARLRGSLNAHLKSLGLKSEAEYRQWCRSRGISDGLHKFASQKRREQRLAKTQQGKSILHRKRTQTRNLRNKIRQLYDRSVSKGRLGADVSIGSVRISISSKRIPRRAARS
jgi:hypothetical protein